MALALVLGALSTVPFLASANPAFYGAVVAAGLAVAIVVADVRHGLVGVLMGVGAGFAVWGGYEVIQRLLSCPENCTGLSSPTITVVIVVGFGVIGLLAAGAGYAVGRIVRSIGRRLSAARA
jgi:hypothetical protein